MRTLSLVIGCDTDPDRPGFVATTPANGLSWKGLTEGIPRLKELVADLRDDDGRPPVFTWLLRVDEQIRHIHGSYSWVLENHARFLTELEAGGDELGWHPHFWRLDSASGRWVQEAHDTGWQVDMLTRAHAAYIRVFPGRAKSVRMGWDYHNNETYQALERLGVVVDFSALPGMATMTAERHGVRENLFDWSITPRQPFRPSRADYRRPMQAGETTCGLIEVPAFVSTSRIWGLLGGLQMARKMNDPHQLWQSLRRPTWWINLTGRPKLFAPLVKALGRHLRKTPDGDTVFVTYFHPDELLENKSSLYSLPSVRTNLEALLRVAKSNGVRVRFSRAQSLAGTFVPRSIMTPRSTRPRRKW